MKRIDVASALIQNEKGELLLVKNKKGDRVYWGLPGGAVEEGETLKQAAIREIEEETGYTATVTGLQSVREMFITERNDHAVIFTFTARITGGQLRVEDPDGDIIDVRWADHSTAQALMPVLYTTLRLTAPGPAFYAFEGVRV
ncbi:NUDIX domain-containing protein [Ectobacillus ponti]|uniref:NUDIX hydrolase n=1 Tax=Ectobacillus ponti TaxID=2961894 RepID=A0AA41XA74_9BACI|nr:NUDIX hydrolase [Ectobacillus ponti]MCP8970008.1 NUDIX hydrolase [Ectobacillus ponti]